jgi:hypothetical protein
VTDHSATKLPGLVRWWQAQTGAAAALEFTLHPVVLPELAYSDLLEVTARYSVCWYRRQLTADGLAVYRRAGRTRPVRRTGYYHGIRCLDLPDNLPGSHADCLALTSTEVEAQEWVVRLSDICAEVRQLPVLR